ncbi:zinc-finger domain-containing protein [Paenibacillus sp. EKM206P]|uniref:zinc-finger domain-containing protein n=1 Tax=Paenibacillus sp. EKM206P TaxID=1683674 RepID=UPI0013EA03F2|nr:zinc-finger domain-containing protein [Paenibacillus sp. EKM206P]
MNRLNAVVAIGSLLDNHCSKCTVRDEFNRKYGSVTSKLDKHCKGQCPIGKKLQEYGKYLGKATTTV